MNIVSLFKSGAILLSKHKSAVLGGVAVVSAIGTAILTAKATVDSCKDVEEMKKNLPISNDETPEEKLKEVEVLKTVWKHYIPAAISLASTITCVVCMHKVDAKKILTATSALALSDKMNKELEKQAKANAVDSNRLTKIKNEVFGQKQVPNDPTLMRSRMELEDLKRNELCWFKDEILGQEFKSTSHDIMRAMVNAIQEGLAGSGVVPLSLLYDLYGLDSCLAGDVLGWKLDSQTIDIGQLEPEIMSNGQPGFIIHYVDKPHMI